MANTPKSRSKAVPALKYYHNELQYRQLHRLISTVRRQSGRELTPLMILDSTSPKHKPQMAAHSTVDNRARQVCFELSRRKCGFFTYFAFILVSSPGYSDSKCVKVAAYRPMSFHRNWQRSEYEKKIAASCYSSHDVLGQRSAVLPGFVALGERR